MNKKFLLSMPIIASLGVPMLATVSCNSSTTDQSKILQLGIRPGAKEYFEKIATQWEVGNPGYKVKLRYITNDIGLNGTLDGWKAAGSQPELMVMDTSWANIYVKKGWFEQLDLIDIASNSKYLLKKQDLLGEYKQDASLEYNFSNFNTLVDDSKVNGKWNHFATGIGPQVAYIWKQAMVGNVKTNILNGAHNLKWYVPNAKTASETNVVEVKFTGTNANTNPLLKADGTHFKNTLEDIVEFIRHSARKDQMKFNGDLDDQDAKSNVLATGFYGQTQRLISVAITLKKAFNLDIVPLDGEFWLPYLGIIQGQQALEANGEANGDISKGIYDDKVFNDTTVADAYKISTKFKESSFSELSKLEKQIWFGSLGYYQDGIIKIPSAMNGGKPGGQGDAVGQGKALAITSGGGWMYTWKFGHNRPLAEVPKGTKQFGIESLQAIPLPFEFAGTEGYAMASGLSESKANLAKTFIRFLMQKQVQIDLNGSSTVATLIKANSAQAYPIGLRPIIQSGIKPFLDNVGSLKTEYIDTFYNVGKKSSRQEYEQFHESFYKNTAWKNKALINGGATFDIKQYIKILNHARDNYQERLATQ